MIVYDVLTILRYVRMLVYVFHILLFAVSFVCVCDVCMILSVVRMCVYVLFRMCAMRCACARVSLSYLFIC